MSCCLPFGRKRENMASCFGSEFLRMIFIVIFCLLLLLQRTHIFNVEEAEAGNFHIHGLLEMYSTEENVRENENQLKRISGQDENEEKEALIVEKFRALLGLKSFYHHRRHFNGYSEHVSPSPSPCIPRAPAPAPALHVHHHRRRPHHPSHWDPLSHNIHKEHRGRAKRILVAVFVSVGVAAVILICSIGLILVCRKFRSHRKKAKRTMPLYSKKKGQKGKSQNSSRKVSMNSGLDLVYLDSLGEDIEKHTCALKQTPETVDTNTMSNHSVSAPVYEREEIKQELNNSSSCSTKEILSVHEDVESMKYETDDGDKVIIPMEDESSDNESFHSIVDSHSSNVRLSNASVVSRSESTSSLSPKASQPNPCSMANSSDIKQQEEKIQTCIKHPQTFVTPPTPPPPPPTSQMPLFQLHSLCSSSGFASQSPRSPTLNILSSPSCSDSNSKSNQPGEIESPSPSQPIRLKSPSSIPPPPCPPPFKVNSNNGKNPPPPPSQLPQFTPIGKDGAPLPKLKPLHWDKVRAPPDRSMVWDKLRTSSFELDEEMIESLFGYNLQNSMKNEETKSKTPSQSKHVLEPKRLQNITILSKALNVTAEQVCEALMQGKGLSLQQLEALVKMIPTKEEEAKLSSYEGHIKELGSAEKFVGAMLGVPFAFQRVEAMLYKETFEDEVFHLRNSFSMLEEACKELRSSRLFLKLLEAVLKTGNRMNVGTIRGGAIAFKLDALLKLADVKGTDGKTTLLHFVVQEIVRSEGIKVSDSIMGKINQKSKNRTEEEKEEDYIRMGLELVSGLSTELYNVKKTATIDLDVLASSVSNLSDGMAKLQHLVQKELSADENSENFVNSMKTFLTYAERNLVELRGDEDRVFTRVKEITEYFHGDLSKEDANPLRIFVIVRDFLGMLDNICRELRRSKVRRTPSPLAPFR